MTNHAMSSVAFDEIEADGGGVEAGQKLGEGGGGDCDTDEEGPAVAMVEDDGGLRDRWAAEWDGVEQAVGGVKDPDGQGHGRGCGERKADVSGTRDETDPQRGHRGRVEREQVPAGDGA